MKSISLVALIVATTTLTFACGSETTRTSPLRGVDEANAQAAPPSRTNDDARQANVIISEDIRRACGLDDTETFFAYNSTHIDAKSQSILKKLAVCFETGALAGRGMKLVGHADPRGDEEYNYVLGGRRADSVKKSLVRVGMKEGRISTTSRGEEDARGTSEASWARDRRVDVLLGS